MIVAKRSSKLPEDNRTPVAPNKDVLSEDNKEPVGDRRDQLLDTVMSLLGDVGGLRAKADTLEGYVASERSRVDNLYQSFLSYNAFWKIVGIIMIVLSSAFGLAGASLAGRHADVTKRIDALEKVNLQDSGIGSAGGPAPPNSKSGPGGPGPTSGMTPASSLPSQAVSDEHEGQDR
jgi:hypothetical protein